MVSAFGLVWKPWVLEFISARAACSPFEAWSLATRAHALNFLLVLERAGVANETQRPMGSGFCSADHSTVGQDDGVSSPHSISGIDACLRSSVRFSCFLGQLHSFWDASSSRVEFSLQPILGLGSGNETSISRGNLRKLRSEPDMPPMANAWQDWIW